MASFNVQEFIDRQPVRSPHYAMLGICGIAMFIDGLDVFMVGKIAPAIAQGLGEERSAMGFVFLLQQIGLAIGAFVATPLADRFGRKRMLIISSLIFGVLTLATAFVTTLTQLAVLRGLAGLFLSGGLPMAVSLVAESTPRHRRGTFIAISFACYSIGSTLGGGAIAAWLIDDFGWQSGFWVGGMLPLLSVPLMYFFLPESLQFTVSRNPHDPRIPAMLRRIDRNVVLDGSEDFVAGDGSNRADKARLTDIFRGGRARTTTLIWLACVCSMGTSALLAAWLPTFFEQMAGIPIQRFAVYAMIGFIGGLVGTLSMGWLMDKFRPSRIIPLFYFGLAATMIGLATVPFGTPVFVGVMIAMSLFQVGGQTGLNTLMTQIYPASMRSTGIGWAGGAGRIGGIVLPLFGWWATSEHFSLELTMTLIATMPLAVAAIILMVRDKKAPPPVTGPAAAGAAA
ncbi:MAG TPA: MFS transporter [Allosphingosinicella sp.]|nr:MFS transporter [Allosphingosinicella sp.]